jgi:hypothetical protein
MAGASNPSKFFAVAAKNWREQAKRAKDSASTLPDASYIGRLNVAEVLPGSTPGTFRSHFAFIIAEGEHEGRTVHKNQNFDHEDSWEWHMREFTRMGYDPEDIDPETTYIPLLKQLTEEKPLVALNAKTGANGYQNWYMNGIIDEGEEPGTAPAETEEEEGGATATEEEEEPETAQEPEEESGEELEVGKTVEFPFNGQPTRGEVLEFVDEDTDEPKVKVRKENGKVSTILIANLTGIVTSNAVEGAEEEEEAEAPAAPAPKKTGTKTPVATAAAPKVPGRTKK